jgi:HK97 family phage major capsid protein
MTMIQRTDAEALIPEEMSAEIFQHLPEGSAIMKLGRRLPNMATNVRRLPVMSALPLAYFAEEAVQYPATGYDNLKSLTNAEWEKKYITAEEIAVILPIPEAVLDDAAYDIWGELRPHLVEAFGNVFDAAVLYGTNAPATWPDGIVPDAVAAGNSLAVGDVGDLWDDIMGVDGDTLGLIAHVESDGYFPNGYIGAVTARGMLRGLRSEDGDGVPLFRQQMIGAGPETSYSLDGQQIYFPLNGAVDAAESLLICGDWTKLVWSLRQDITYKVLDQSVIQDPDTGSIIYNLAQQDMVALRAVLRIGWQVPNPINRTNTDADTRYPFSVLTPAES